MPVSTPRAVLAAGLIFVSMTSICLFGIVVQAPLLLISPPIFRIMTSRLVGTWELFCGWLLEVVYGIKPIVTGDAMDADIGSVIVSNHRTRLDWAMLWSVLARSKGGRGTFSLKVVLKAAIRGYPIMGWACMMARYIFLKRKWEDDEHHLKAMLRLLGSESYSLLIFPEGTDLNSQGLERSDKWADERGLPRYRQILHPKTKGTIEMLKTLKDVRFPVQKFYDVTMAYRGPIAQGESALVKGKTPDAMHVHITAFDVDKDLPKDDEGLDAFVRARFRLKEEALGAFYADEKVTLEECLLKTAKKLEKENPFNGTSAGTGSSPLNATPNVTSGSNGAGATPEASRARQASSLGNSSTTAITAAPSSSSSASPSIPPALAYRCSKNSNPEWAGFPLASYFSAGVKVAVFVLFGGSLVAAYPLATLAWFVFVTGFFAVTNKFLGGLDSFEISQAMKEMRQQQPQQQQQQQEDRDKKSR